MEFFFEPGHRNSIRPRDKDGVKGTGHDINSISLRDTEKVDGLGVHGHSNSTRLEEMSRYR
jgi:hypothetical protein